MARIKLLAKAITRVRLAWASNPGKVKSLQRTLYFGIPEDGPPRDNPNDPSNAQLLYWHEFGTSTEPPRPSVGPGMEAIKGEVRKRLKEALKAELNGKEGEVDKALNACGVLGVATIKAIIREGIPPPISERTKKWRLQKKRAYKNAGPLERQAMMEQWMSQDFTPLVDTEQMINAITYMLRKRK